MACPPACRASYFRCVLMPSVTSPRGAGFAPASPQVASPSTRPSRRARCRLNPMSLIRTTPPDEGRLVVTSPGSGTDRPRGGLDPLMGHLNLPCRTATFEVSHTTGFKLQASLTAIAFAVCPRPTLQTPCDTPTTHPPQLRRSPSPSGAASTTPAPLLQSVRALTVRALRGPRTRRGRTGTAVLRATAETRAAPTDLPLTVHARRRSLIARSPGIPARCSS